VSFLPFLLLFAIGTLTFAWGPGHEDCTPCQIWEYIGGEWQCYPDPPCEDCGCVECKHGAYRKCPFEFYGKDYYSEYCCAWKCDIETQFCCHTYPHSSDCECCNNDTQTCCNGDCCDKDCEACVNDQCKLIDIDSVTSNKDVACIGCDVTFTVVTDPPGHGDKVSWSGGGTPPSQYGGSTFTTHWYTHGSKTVTASICTKSGSKQVTIAAPTNFHQVGSGVDIGNGALQFYYEWESTTGNLSDLSGCKVGEKVDYPGGNPYYWPSPPWFGSTDNPTTTDDSATIGFGWDTHSTKPFTTPYQGSSFSATQIYRYWGCPGPPYTTLMGPHSINRSVYADPGCSSGWEYKVQKTGASATVCLP